MKILWVSHFLLYPQTGYGALQRSRNLFAQLAKRHEVFMVSYLRGVDLEIADPVEAKKDLSRLCAKVTLIPFPADRKSKKYSSIAKGLLSMSPYSAAIYTHKKMESAVEGYIRKYDIQAVHADTLGLTDNIARSIKGLKVLNHHNIESNMMARRAVLEQNFIKRFFILKEAKNLLSYERNNCPKYDLNLTVSEVDEERLKGICGANLRTSVIENGVDCDFFAHNLRRNCADELVFTGSMNWYPNEDAVFFFCSEVWPRIKQARAGLKLTIIGKNATERIKNLAKKNPGITLYGHVDDVRPFVKRAKVFICPIRDGGGTKLKVLDALAQGIPMVSTRLGVEGINVKDREQVLLAEKPEEFANKVIELLDNKELSDSLSVNGRKFVERHYSFNTLGEKLSRTYQLEYERKAENVRHMRLDCAKETD